MLLKKNPHREVQGRVCYEIAQQLALEHRHEPSAVERRTAIRFLQRVLQEFSDISHWRHGTLGAAARQDLFELEHLVVGATAPATRGVDVEGREMSLADFRGKVVVLDFWGSWCGPCIGDLPILNALAGEFGDDVEILGVMSDPPAQAREAVDKHNVRFRNWVDGDDREGPIVKLWNIDSWPTKIVLDQRGVIRHTNVRIDSVRDSVWRLLQDI